MRFLPWLLMFLATTSAQTSVSSLLELGMPAAPAGAKTVPETEKTAVIKATADLLSKHVTFRPDGTASAFYSTRSRRPVEWKGFSLRSISKQAVTEADRLNGISNRYFVALTCTAHRTWDMKTNRWGEWTPVSNPAFPSGIRIESKNGQLAAVESAQLKSFTPGPGPSVTDPKPSGKSIGLPPGMTRGK